MSLRRKGQSSGTPSLVGKTQTYMQGMGVLGVGLNEQLYLKQARASGPMGTLGFYLSKR